MRWIVESALRLRVAVVALALVLMVAGTRTALDTPLDVFPEFAPPLVEIQTEAPGLSTIEVESLVTVQLENAMNGVVGLKTLRSKSVLGLSSVVLIFDEGTNLMAARQLVQERLFRVATALPAAARPSVILSPLSSLSRVMKIGVSSSRLSQVELTTLAKWTVRPRLMSIPGVANVAIWGQRDRQLQVLVDPDRLRASNVTLDELLTATREGTSVTGGGYLETAQQRLAIAHAAAVTQVDDLKQIIIGRTRSNTIAFSSNAVRVGDVAAVVEGFPPPIGDAVINDGPGLLLIVEKHPDGNTLQVTRDVEAALESLKPGLPGVVVDSTIFRPATFIEMSLENLNRALLIGCVLVILVLAVFLYDWRTALISTIAIPLSLITAALMLPRIRLVLMGTSTGMGFLNYCFGTRRAGARGRCRVRTQPGRPASGDDVRAGAGRQQLAVRAQEIHARAGHPRAQPQHLGPQLELLADRGAQVVDAQVDGAQLGEALQPLQWRLLEVARADRGHHRQAAHRVQPGADHAAVQSLVGEVADQLGPHLDVPGDALGRHDVDLQAQHAVEHHALFEHLLEHGDELGLESAAAHWASSVLRTPEFALGRPGVLMAPPG